MKNVYETLEFDRLLNLIAPYAKTERGRDYIFSMHLIKEKEALNKELSLLKEMMSLLVRYGALPLSTSSNLERLVVLAKKGGVLSVNELEQVAEDILTSLKISKYLANYKEEYPLLGDYSKEFIDISPLEVKIHQVISPSLSIYDNASKELLRIRNNIKKIEDDIKRKMASLARSYESLLSDNTITMRNGHFVLPVKTGEKNKVPGIIHDVSDTGLTTFIEPSSIVELNNNLYSYKNEEHEEVMRLLKELSKDVINNEGAIINNNKLIGYLDFVSAKALFGNEKNAVIAETSVDQVISLKRAKHPLLDEKTCVANDFYLDNQKHIMLISGPNAGGKSVALKVVGISVVMHLCGLPIMCQEGAQIPLFKRIYIDIGDQQSISDSLSTFSAHMENIVFLSKHLGMKDLVILDELGTGTDPKEGEALALSLIDFIHARKAMAFITSHFNGVKTYGLNADYVENGSMIFNVDDMSPTYKLRLGIPGKSYGIEVAEKLGLDENIVKIARKYLKNSYSKESSSLEELHHLMEENEKLSESLIKERTAIESKEKELKILEDNLNKKKEHLLESVEEEKEEILQNAKEKIDEIMNSLKDENIKLHQVISAKKDLDSLDYEETEDEENNEDIKVNDLVRINSLNLEGTVLRVNKNRVLVMTSKGRIDSSSNDVIKVAKTKETKKKSSTYIHQIDEELLRRSIPLEINLIGMHVEEALKELESYLDSVIVKNYKQIRIIHGSGTGTLRKAVHEFLAKQKTIDSYRLGGQNEGGVGATVVYFK